MSVASFGNRTAVLLMLSPVLLHGYLTCGKIIENPGQIRAPWTLLLIDPIKKLLNYGNVNRSQLILVRADMEVYTGFYVIIGWFLGMSSILSIMLYWQVMRVRSMLNT